MLFDIGDYFAQNPHNVMRNWIEPLLTYVKMFDLAGRLKRVFDVEGIELILAEQGRYGVLDSIPLEMLEEFEKIGRDIVAGIREMSNRIFIEGYVGGVNIPLVISAQKELESMLEVLLAVTLREDNFNLKMEKDSGPNLIEFDGQQWLVILRDRVAQRSNAQTGESYTAGPRIGIARKWVNGPEEVFEFRIDKPKGRHQLMMDFDTIRIRRILRTLGYYDSENMIYGYHTPLGDTDFWYRNFTLFIELVFSRYEI